MPSAHESPPESFDGGECSNCGARLMGVWCHSCGQKNLAREHRTLRWLLGELVGKWLNLEGKLPRTLVALVLRPGRLGAEWMAGRRVRWTSPIALFLVVNLLYFLSPPVTDFNLPLADQLRSQRYSDWALSQVETRVPGVADWFNGREGAEMPVGYRAFEAKFERRSESLTKTLLILQVPLLAVFLLVLHFRRRLLFVDHFVVALHYWTFLLFMLIVYPRVSVLINQWLYSWGWVSSPRAGEDFWKLSLVGLALVYLTLLLRRTYSQSWGLSLAKTLPAFFACALSHMLYRALLFTVTLWLVS